METASYYRTETLKARDRLSLIELKEKSSIVQEKFLQLIGSMPNQTIFIYVSCRSEVDTITLIGKLLAAGKTVTVPLVDVRLKRMRAVWIDDLENDLVSGCFGTLEPKENIVFERTVDPSTIDIIVLPGSVFDLDGGRLGYGGGYYDRFLATEIQPRVKRIAFAFDLQIKDRIPQKVHDEPVDLIVSESRVVVGKRLV